MAATQHPGRAKSTRADAAPVHETGRPPAISTWISLALGIAALALAFYLYGPSLHGPFLFDDFGLPFSDPQSGNRPLSSWLSGVRPILMLSYWANFQSAQSNTFTYHAVNVMLHAINALLVFALFSRILTISKVTDKRRLVVAAICGILFLVHPLQAEAVAYVAGRSEILSAFFCLLALV